MTEAVQPSGLLRAAGLNAGIRIAALGSRLLLIVYIAKFLSVSDMAIFGLVSTSIGMAVTIIGMEFYAFSTREILATTNEQRSHLLRDQLVLHAVAYLLLIPFSLPLFVWGVLPWDVAGIFFALTILEHLAQETARIFNTLFRPVLSTAMFFVRSAAWGYVVMGIGWWRPEWNTIRFVFWAWLVGVAVSVVLSLVALHSIAGPVIWTRRVDWAWIRQGLLVAAPFMISALSYRVIELADRYIIHFMLTDIEVGVYSFFASLANVVPAVVGAGVTSVLNPRILDAYLAGRTTEYRRLFRTMTVLASTLSLAAVPVGVVGIAWLLPFTEKAEYAAELGTSAVLFFSTAVAVISQIPGVALYARKDDRALLYAVVVGAVTNTVLNLLWIPRYGILGAAWATTVAFAAMGCYQMYRASCPSRQVNEV